MAKTRILVVDDSVVVRRLLTHVLSADPTLEVVGSAPNRSIALAKISQVNPDVITLDIEMAEGEGLKILAALRKNHPHLPVVIFSPLKDQTPAAGIEMLTLGASDFVTRAVNVSNGELLAQIVRDELIPKIKMHAIPGSPGPAYSSAMTRKVGTAKAGTGASNATRLLATRTDVLVIGVSTGGPNALSKLLGYFPPDFPVPVLIVQHMPPMFTRLLSDRLDMTCQLRVAQGTTNQLLEPGHAWMAPGDFHMVLKRQDTAVRIQLHQGAPENSCRPAADVLFRSAAEAYGSHVLAVVLTGMGQDGLRGCERIREAGGQIFVQDEASSVVWGMPGAIVGAGLADKVLPIDRLGEVILQTVSDYRAVFPTTLPKIQEGRN